MRAFVLGLLLSVVAVPVFAQQAESGCSMLPSHAELKSALIEARKKDNGGLNLDMWGAVVDRSGTVCAIAYTGNSVGAQWPGSRLISAQKAGTANAFSLKSIALSTANLYSATQPGGFLFGLQESNPINVNVAYSGSANDFGSEKDPLVGQMLGGVNVFGGGLALYNSKGDILGGIGVSGDTSCADHNIASRTRQGLQLDYVQMGVSADKDDQIIYDIESNKSTSGFGHPTCGNSENDVATKLSKIRKMNEKAE